MSVAQSGILSRLADKREITALLSSRADASDDHDVERMIACHTDDGTDDHGSGSSTARQFIENVAATRYADPDNGPQKHVLANVVIDFRGEDEAFVESYHLAYHRMGMTGVQRDDLVGGRYLDVFKREGGRWLIDRRTVVYDWSRSAAAIDPAAVHRQTTVRETFASQNDTKGTDMDETTLAELADKQAITEVLYTRARAADRRDHELALSCYHEDATEVHEGFSTTAREFLLEKSLYAPGREAPSHTLMHIVTNVLIDLRSSDEAFVESYHLCLMSGKSGDAETDAMIGGRYLDTFRRVNGRWGISHREVVFDWSRKEAAAPRLWDENENKHLISFGVLGDSDPLYEYVERGAGEVAQ